MKKEWLENQEDGIRKKAESLAKKLTLDEKIGMIHGASLFQTKGVERLGIPPLKMSDGPMGVRQEFLPDKWKAVGHTDDYVTYLPCNSALASTWNRKLARDMGSVLGAEARGRGKDVILAPGINLKRSPLCGRNFEYFSEDPYLTGQLAAPFVQGVQSWDVAACVKHFAVNNQETERLWMEVKVDEKVLRTLYLPAFYDALKKGGAYTVMGAYNKLYGQHCCQNEFLLNQVLRREWEYDGLVISDWGAVHDTEAAAGSQLDIEMSVTYNFDEYFMAEPLKKAVEEGRVKEEAIDEKVIRILMLMMRLHMMDGTRKAGCYNTEEHRQTALEVARESVVLLKNQAGRLPLSREKAKKVLVIGDNGNCIHSSGGGSGEIKALYEITPFMGIKKLLGGNAQVDYIQGYCRDAVKKEEEEVNWQEASLEHGGGSTKESGAGQLETVDPAEAGERLEAVDLAEEGSQTEAANPAEVEGQTEAANSTGAGGQTETANPTEAGGQTETANPMGAADSSELLARMREQLRREALELAPQYDQVIFVGGLNHDQDCEGNDRADMKLPYGQDTLISQLLDIRPDTIIVMMGGSPVEMGQWIGKADSLVWSWYNGMEGGTALAEVLYGLVNPSGKLPESFYKTHTDCSAHCVGEFGKNDYVEYKEGLFVGYRYLDSYHVDPQFCFGHGLSYTDFSFRDGAVEHKENGAVFSCLITNTGDCAGAETVQVYVRPREENEPGMPSVFQELKGFEKVFLNPGETKKVIIELEGNLKDAEIAAGSSSRDIRILV